MIQTETRNKHIVSRTLFVAVAFVVALIATYFQFIGSSASAASTVTLDPENNQLIVRGENFLQDELEYSDSIMRSMVTLNDEPLPFCTYGFTFTLEEIIELMSEVSPDIATLVSDEPPCYAIYESPGVVSFTPEQVFVFLPDDFDYDAPGTVSVNGGETIAFNTGEGESPNITPTIKINGLLPASGVTKLPKNLSFKGVATPFAEVVVTVHSDPVSCQAIADTQGDWACSLSKSLPSGQHAVYVEVTNPDDSVVELGPYPIHIASTSTGAPVYVSPPKSAEQVSFINTGWQSAVAQASNTPSTPQEEDGISEDPTETIVPNTNSDTPGTETNNQSDETGNINFWLAAGSIAALLVLVAIISFVVRGVKSSSSRSNG